MNWISSARRRKYVTVPILIFLLFASLLPARTARSQSTSPVSYTFEECAQVSKAGLRDELNRITQAVFEEGRKGIGVADIVERKWQELGLDSMIDQEVDSAVVLVRNDTPFWKRIWSAWSSSTAEELAVRVVNEAFGTDTFETRFDELSTQVANDIVGEIRLVTAESASTALVCVHDFIGDRFSNTMAGVLDKKIQEELKVLMGSPDTDIDFIDILETHSNFAGGVAVVIGTRIGTEIAKKLATVVAKNIVTRIISRALVRIVTLGLPVIGWIIGGFLIVKDVYDSSDGALPLIRDSLKGDEVKAELRARTAEGVNEELRTELPELARSIANGTYSKWQDFRRKFSRVLDLAENLPRFKSILDRTEIDQVAKLAELVHLLEEKEPDQLEGLIRTGDFEFILALPEEALEILRVTGKSEILISWARFAEELVLQVLETELYLVASPTDLNDRAELERILALEDAVLIQKLMLLESEERDALLSLPATHTQQLLDAFSTEDLTWLASLYLNNLVAEERNILIDRVLRQPGLMAELGNEVVRQALLDTQDFAQALNYIPQNTGEKPIVGQVLDMLPQIRPAVSGELPWALFWHYYGAILRNAVYAIVGLVALSILWRMVLFRRRRQDVNVTVVLPESRDGSSSDPASKGGESTNEDHRQ